MNYLEDKLKKQHKILTSGNQDIFKIANLQIQVKNEFVLAATALPELESNKEGKILVSKKEIPDLWRAWVVAIGPGKNLNKVNLDYNPGIYIYDYIYFKPSLGRFVDFNNISMVFVKMSDIDLLARV